MLQVLLVAEPFPTPCRSLSRVVGSVVRGRPCQPAVAVGVVYSSMAICAGVSCAIRITWPNRPHRAVMADTLIGPHANQFIRKQLYLFTNTRKTLMTTATEHAGFTVSPQSTRASGVSINKFIKLCIPFVVFRKREERQLLQLTAAHSCP